MQQSASLAAAGAMTHHLGLHVPIATPPSQPPLQEFGYADVTITSEPHETQLHDSHAVLMDLSDDSLLKPFRQMAGQPAPGADLGGWYHYDPDYDPDHAGVGFAPGATFGQWVSALARGYAITGSAAVRDKVLRLNHLYAQTISADFYTKNRFPAYCYDKLVCGLIDSHQFAGDPDAFSILERTTDTALPHLPGKAIEHDQRWRDDPRVGFTWDESYTISENLFLAYQRGAGTRYRDLGTQYLDDAAWYDPLAVGRNVLAGRHAYSYVNSLSSAMQAYLTLGSDKHLRAGRNGFDMLAAQSYATGAWGPDEQLRAPGSEDLAASLTNTHWNFETPCGSYAHFKLTRYLLRVTRDSRYGDSMERVMYNTILGAKPLLADGSTFYYSDYNFHGRKFYKEDHWPCCSGTFPQVAADYRINTYFRDAGALYVNLYIPSTVRWTHDGAQVSLAQTSSYPFDSAVKFDLSLSKSAEFAIHFRIPSWALGASISVNGKLAGAGVPALPGSFVKLRRTWKNGDRVELDLPMPLHLESIDERHPGTVALVSGPLVLFAVIDTVPAAVPGQASTPEVITESSGHAVTSLYARDVPPVTADQLLSARKMGPQRWQVGLESGKLTMLPFTAITDQQYSTYLIAR
jgi:uncharacterized protein